MRGPSDLDGAKLIRDFSFIVVSKSYLFRSRKNSQLREAFLIAKIRAKTAIIE